MNQSKEHIAGKYKYKTIYLHSDEIYIGEVLNHINQLKNEGYPIDHIYIEADVRSSYGDEYATMSLHATKDATPEELEQQRVMDKAREEELIQKERQEYERLKNKFGGQ